MRDRPNQHKVGWQSWKRCGKVGLLVQDARARLANVGERASDQEHLTSAARAETAAAKAETAACRAELLATLQHTPSHSAFATLWRALVRASLCNDHDGCRS